MKSLKLTSIQNAYSTLPIAVKLFLPLLFLFFLFLGVWTVGTYSFFRGAFEKDLREETEEFASVLLHDLKQQQALLQSKARWIADGKQLSQAVAARNQAALLQTLLPSVAALELDFIKVLTKDGAVLANVQQHTLSQTRLQDQQVSRAAVAGLELSDIIATEGAAPSVLVSLISLRNQERVLGGVIVGSALSDERLNQIRDGTKMHLVVVQDSRITASTLPVQGAWQYPAASDLRLAIAGQRYIAKTVRLDNGSNTPIRVVLLNPTTSLEQAEQKLLLSIGVSCLLGGVVALLICLWVSRWLTRRIQTLTDAAEQLADGDFATRIIVDSQDEIGILAQGFNFMAEQLTQRDRQIKQQVDDLGNTLQALKQAQVQLVHGEKMSSLGQMVAGIAHEINNPVNFIHGNLNYVEEYADNLLHLVNTYEQEYPASKPRIQQEIEDIDLAYLRQDLPKLVKSMRMGTDRICEIVLSLRNFSRLDEAVFKAVDLHEGIGSTLLILQNRLKAKAERPEIQVIKEYGELPLIECYAGQLNQVFMNILANAIDALDDCSEKRTYQEIENSPNQIRIRTQLVDSDWVSICITDNGLGIPEEVRSHIFEPFFTTKTVGKGTGLGLSIGYQIVVDKHGGKLLCNSFPGRGTEFVITIPVRHS